MARLEGEAPGHWAEYDEKLNLACGCSDFEEHMRKEDESIEALGWDQIITFPRGDGIAGYYVKRVSPPVLQWVPFGDRWQVEDALIRGLRSSDIQQMLDASRRIRALFS